MKNAAALSCDVLVIGGGMAALAAAIAAAREGVKVLVASDGEAGKSGATYYDVAEVGAMNAPDSDPSDSAEVFYQDIADAALSMASLPLCRILAEQANDTVQELTELPGGEALFEREDGTFKVFQACFSSKARSHIIHDHFRPLLQILMREAVRQGVQFVRCMAAELFVENGQCFGAYGIDPENREILLLSKAVVLACGGSSQLFAHNLYPRDVMGGGYAMAHRAGAMMTNMEFIQMGIGVTYPFINLFEHYLWDCYPQLKNGNGEAFLARYLPDGCTERMAIDDKSRHFPFSTRDFSRFVEIAVQTEINEGRITPHGGIYLDLNTEALHALLQKDSNVSRMWHTTRSWYREKGVDLLEQPLEIACFAHAINGGVLIDENAKTSIDGLYAVGEVAAGPHGADRLGGNMSLTSQVFGRIAGRQSAAWAKKTPSVPDGGKFLSQCSEFYRTCALPDEETEILTRIQQMGDRSLLIVRNEKQLKWYQSNLEQLRNDLCGRGSQRLSREAVQLFHLLETGELIAQAALARRESRGSHFREDYPQREDCLAQNYIIERGKGRFQSI